jgi:hypothetical protein
MPILGRTPEECFKRFRAHVAKLVAATLPTESVPVLYEGRGPHRVLSFRSGACTTIPLRTRFGLLHFYIGQSLKAVKEGEEYRLETHEYWYRLQVEAGTDQNAFLRWEYKKSLVADEPNYCRNHIQIAATTSGIDLKKVHIPSGWTTMEEVIRFLIMDLGVKPPCGDNWPKKLADSEKAFFTEFTSKRYKK